jgi:hypothetical protein
MYALGMRAALQISTYTKYPDVTKPTSDPDPDACVVGNKLVVSETYMSGGTRIKAERVFVREQN